MYLLEQADRLKLGFFGNSLLHRRGDMEDKAKGFAIGLVFVPGPSHLCSLFNCNTMVSENLE